MRKLILLLMLCTVLDLSAQKISLDRIENDGRHQIMTTSKDYSIDGAKYSVSMKVFETWEWGFNIPPMQQCKR